MEKKLNIKNHQIKFLLNKFNVKTLADVKVSILKNLKEQLKKGITDVRQQGKIEYKIWDIIVCGVVANYACVYDWNDIHDFVEAHYKWFKSFLQMTGGIPTGQTYERVFSLINHKELENILVDFYKSLVFNVLMNRDIKNIDGRVSKGSARRKTDYNEETRPLNSLNLYSNTYGICLASEVIDEKTNEIPSIPNILKRVNIEDSIITWDALNTQTDNVYAVIDGGGDYVVPIKGNQGNFHQDLIDYFNEKTLETIIAGRTLSGYLKQTEKSHSSIITYEYFQIEDINWYFDKDKWAGLRSIGMVRKTIEKNGESKTEIRYYISSLPIDIIDFSKAIRMHWSVENKLHWHLDFTFKEDDNTTKNKKALMNLQLVNKFTLATLNKVKPFYNNISLKRIRTRLSFEFEENFINLLIYLSLI